MRNILVRSLAAYLLLGAAAHAQVINGEGTYEGSSLHTPPPDSDAPRTRDDQKQPDAIKPPSPKARD